MSHRQGLAYLESRYKGKRGFEIIHSKNTGRTCHFVATVTFASKLILVRGSLGAQNSGFIKARGQDGTRGRESYCPGIVRGSRPCTLGLGEVKLKAIPKGLSFAKEDPSDPGALLSSNSGCLPL